MSVPLWLEASDDDSELWPLPARRTITLRFSIASGVAPRAEGAPVMASARARLIDFIEHTPVELWNVTGSPTVVMAVAPFEATPVEIPSVERTLPWPASYPYERVLRLREDGPVASSELNEIAFVDGAAELEEEVAVAEPTLATDEVDCVEAEAEITAAEPALAIDGTVHVEAEEGVPVAEPVLAIDRAAHGEAEPEPQDAAAKGPDRADELLMRFASGSDGETNIKAAAKGLRAIAGIDLTPSIISAQHVHTSATGPVATIETPSREPAPADDITPPATSEPALSSRPPRASSSRRGFARGVVAFAAGLAGAAAVGELAPTLPDDVVEALVHAIPTADPPSPPPPPAEAPGAPPETEPQTEPPPQAPPGTAIDD